MNLSGKFQRNQELLLPQENVGEPYGTFGFDSIASLTQYSFKDWVLSQHTR